MVYTKYDPTTGEIECWVECPASELEFYTPYVEGEYSAEEYLIVDGVPVRRNQVDIDATELEQAWFELKDMRTRMLKDSDWTQVPDAPVDAAAWATYRQQLRDLPENTEDPANPAWPTKPE
jgi:hypothetical protein